MLRRPFILSAVAVAALLALAASAAHTRPLGAVGNRSGSLPASYFDYTIAILVIVGAVVCIAVSPSYLRVAMERRKPGSFPLRVLGTVGVLCVVLVLIALILRRVRIGGPLRHTTGHGGGTVTVGSWHLPLFWVELLAVLGVGVFVVLVVYGLRSRATGRQESRRTETLAQAISGSLGDLRSDADLRRAIVAAYARMERALAASGVPRDPAEAPHEYLERALLSVDASAGAARRLTELFERAKFSHHEPAPAMRDEAIDALVAIRDELRAGREVAA